MYQCRNIRRLSYTVPLILVLAIYIVMYKYILTKTTVSDSRSSEYMMDNPDDDDTVRELRADVKLKDRAESTVHISRKETDIYVVEEHHEVLPVWFGAVSSGIIPGKGNTLIHIDGHDDMALPIFTEDYPVWKFPSNKNELKAMMQDNDVFIVEAIMTGLINRVIWVWPKWDDPENHDVLVKRQLIEVGWAIVKGNTNSLNWTKVFCICRYEDFKKKKECQYAIRTNGKITDNNMPSALCNAQQRIVLEELREDKFVLKLSRRALLGANEHVMLDIDEDYHGCTYASIPLLNAGFTEQSIKEINNILKNLICPKTSKQEKKADDKIMDIIERIKKMPYNCKQNSTENRECRKVNKIFTNFAGSSTFLCATKNVTNIEELSNAFLYKLRRLNLNQLNALQYVGFCFSTTPKSSEKSGRTYRLCSGINTPNKSQIFAHVPHLHELQKRSWLLHTMLTLLKNNQPRLTTLCRSVRDGYTPREHFQTIEANTISALKSAFHRINLHYDIDLLGGKQGWRSKDIWSTNNKIYKTT